MSEGMREGFSKFILLNATAEKEIIDMAVEELDAMREMCGISAEQVTTYVDAVEDGAFLMLRVRMEENNHD